MNTSPIKAAIALVVGVAGIAIALILLQVVAQLASFQNTVAGARNLLEAGGFTVLAADEVPRPISTFLICASDAETQQGCDYKADGTDDHVQLIAARNACPNDGCLIHLSEGTFTIGEPASMPTTAVIEVKSNMHIRGAGMNATVVQAGDERGVAPTDRYLVGTGSGEGAYAIKDASISDLTLLAQDSSDHGIQIKGVERFRVENVSVRHSDSGQSADEGIQISSNDNDFVRDVDLVNVHVEGFGADCIEASAGDVPYSVQDVRIWGMVAEGCNSGFGTRNGPGDIWIFGGAFRDNTLDGLNITASERIYAIGIEASGNGQHGVNANNSSSKGLTVRDCVLQDNAQSGAFFGGTDQTIEGCLVTNNGRDASRADETLRSGIRLNGDDSIVRGNRVYNESDLSVADESGTVSCVETNGSAALDDTGAVFTSAIRDGTHFVQVLDTGGEVVTGFIGVNDPDGNDTRIQLFNSSARTAQNWVGGGASAFDCSATPLTFDVYSEDHGVQLYDLRIESGATGLVEGNDFGGGYAAILSGSFTSSMISGDNQGYVTKSQGLGLISNGSTSDTVSHGLSRLPSAGSCWFIGAEDPTNTVGAHWIDTFTATEMTLNVENDPGASNYLVAWFCDVR